MLPARSRSGWWLGSIGLGVAFGRLGSLCLLRLLCLSSLCTLHLPSFGLGATTLALGQSGGCWLISVWTRFTTRSSRSLCRPLWSKLDPLTKLGLQYTWYHWLYIWFPHNGQVVITQVDNWLWTLRFNMWSLVLLFMFGHVLGNHLLVIL